MVSMLICIAVLNGCSTTVQAENYSTRRYLGWLEVTQRAQGDEPATIERVRATGLKFGAVTGIGYFDDSVIALSPQCRLIINLKSPEQMDAFIQRFPQFMKESKPCLYAIDF